MEREATRVMLAFTLDAAMPALKIRQPIIRAFGGYSRIKKFIETECTKVDHQAFPSSFLDDRI